MWFKPHNLKLQQTWSWSRKEVDGVAVSNRPFMERLQLLLGWQVSLYYIIIYNMEVSWNRGTPEFALINQPFWGSHIYGSPHIHIYIYIYPNNLGSITPKDQSSRVFYTGGHCWGMVIPDHGLPLTWSPRWSRRSVEMTGEILPPPELEMTSHSCWILKIPTLIYIYIHLNTFMTFNWIVVESCAKPTAQFHNPSPSQHLNGC